MVSMCTGTLLRGWVCSVWVLTLVSSVSSSSSSDAGDGDGKSAPPFFLQDSSDGMCLAGSEFKRCAIDTLFYVEGSPGSYQIHKRQHHSDGDGNVSHGKDDKCLAVRSCAPQDVNKVMPVVLAPCSHCGAVRWNILGDASTGYVLTENDGVTCLYREPKTTRAVTGPCEGRPEYGDSDASSTKEGDSQQQMEELTYTPMNLQFATSRDLELMGSDGARLIDAAAEGDLDAVKTFLTASSSPDPDARDWDGLTALIPAASGGHLSVVKFLLEKGADVDAADKDGITALMEASIVGHADVVAYLLEKEASVDSEASSGVTALWLAASEGRLDVMELLLAKGADRRSVRTTDGVTALMTASAGGHDKAVRKLLTDDIDAEPADATAVDRDGLTALINGAESGNVEVLKALLESVVDTDDEPTKRQAYVDTFSETGFTALIVASAHGHVDILNYLTSSTVKATIDGVQPESGVTSLMYAAAGGHKDAVETLLKAGAEVDCLHSNGGSALLEASTAGAAEVMKVLIAAGAKVDRVDKDGVTPLMAAASMGHVDCILILWEALQANLNANDLITHIDRLSESGGSAVMFAAGGGHLEATKLLVETCGADVARIARATPQYVVDLAKALEDGTATEEQKSEKHVDGVTALHVAAQGGHLECVEYLLQRDVAPAKIADDDQRTPLLMAVKGNHGDVAAALVRDGGADPNTVYVDDDGEKHNLLMDAIIVENEEFAVLLIEAGAYLHYRDDHGVTTLLQASHRGMLPTVQALVTSHLKIRTADQTGPEYYLDASSDEGITPLIAAASEGHADVVKYLLETSQSLQQQTPALLGPRCDGSDRDGTTALMAASARGHLEAARLLLDLCPSSTKEQPPTPGSGVLNVNAQNVDGHTALMFAYNGKNQVETLWERYYQFVEEARVTADGSVTTSADQTDVDDGGTGPIIKEALQNHTELVGLLMKHGADPSLQDKEGHVASDFDYHPDTDEDILQQEDLVDKLRKDSKYEL